MLDDQKYVSLNISDNTVMKAYISYPQDKSKTYPGLILFQEAGGVNANIRGIAERLSHQGYIVITPELFHRSSDPAFQIDHVDMEKIMVHIKQVTKEGLSADVKASWNWLQNNPQVDKENIGCIGFCMGGKTAFLANTLFPFKGAVSYYGGGIVPDLLSDCPKLNADMLFFWGGKDGHIPQENVDKLISNLKKHNKEYTNIVFSYADHAFFREGGPTYNEKAAKESWELALRYLNNRLSNN